ncbi:GTPase, putative [Plasmodium vinckei vinckei]|uniref:GTPase, putative n=1 Tax=Plasmodium vinckei vinckei TaxID=54757 RepID=A0A449BZF7_PLAVN|nr:GTPase, putative [Plasmodium vinckei vinckei]VEV58699.1 GTPase, putative [Plasmodium vinckei vinckei]
MILLQVTVLGYLNTGKTSLVNSIMNNEVFNTYMHTEMPMIYYKVYRERNRSFCVEIEDTSIDVNVNIFMNMLRKEIKTNKNHMTNPVFSLFEKPMIPFSHDDQYNSVCYGRMAYLLVFDLTNPSTFEYAKMIYLNMSNVYNRLYTLKPFITLVGNKYGIFSQADESNKDLINQNNELLRQAEDFSNEHMIQLWLTSAHTGKNVKKLFVHVINMVYNNTNLWKYDADDSMSESSED